MQGEKERIKMQAVLANINAYEQEGQLHEFSLHYVKTDGKKGFKPQVRKSGNVYKTDKAAAKSNFGYKLKEHGVIMLHDQKTGNIFSLKIALITHYNGIRIQH